MNAFGLRFGTAADPRFVESVRPGTLGLVTRWSAVEERIAGLTKELLLRAFPVLDRIAGGRFGVPLRARTPALCLVLLLAGGSWHISAGLASTPAE